MLLDSFFFNMLSRRNYISKQKLYESSISDKSSLSKSIWSDSLFGGQMSTLSNSLEQQKSESFFKNLFLQSNFFEIITELVC